MPAAETAIFTGTIDPFHIGHAWTIDTACSALSLAKVIIGLHHSNPYKPHATSYEHREAMTNIGIQEASLSVPTLVQPLIGGSFEAFIGDNVPEGNLVRVLGSDSLSKTIKVGHLSELALCHYAVVLRPLLGQAEMESDIADLPRDVRKKLSYEIIGEQEEVIESRRIRLDVDGSYAQGLITPGVYEYIVENSLYQTATTGT